MHTERAKCVPSQDVDLKTYLVLAWRTNPNLQQ